MRVKNGQGGVETASGAGQLTVATVHTYFLSKKEGPDDYQFCQPKRGRRENHFCN
jgi:hypothetical protein